MIINNQKQQTIVSEGDTNSKVATISRDKLSKLQYMLTNGLYSDAQSAIIVELANNAMDSIIESGKDPLENPVHVNIYQDSKGNYQLSIRDNGIGMDKDFFENRFMSLLDSTKENDDRQIGAYGIGGKCWSGMNRSVTFTIVKDGKLCKYLCYKGEEFIEYDLILEKDTKEENGVLFEMQLNGRSEFLEFSEKAKKKLSYYDTVVLSIDGKVWDNKIYRNDLFQFSSNTPYSYMHFTLKDVVYTIDFDKLGIPPIPLPIALRFGLADGLIPNPSREVILMTKETVELIKARIREVAEFFVKKYNDNTKEFNTFLEAMPFIDTPNKNITIQDRMFDISCMEVYSKIKFQEPKIKDVSLRDGKYYKQKKNDMLEEYTVVAFDDRGTWRRKHISFELGRNVFNLNDRSYSSTILVDAVLSGNVKDFLRNKYKKNRVVYVQKVRERKLKGTYHFEGYKSLLLLTKDKDKWRDYIKEWQLVQNTVTSIFIDETNIENSKDYIKFLEDKRALQKENRAKGNVISNYKALNKQVGQITINKFRHRKHQSTVTCDRFAIDVSKLNSIGRLTVYVPKDDVTEDVKSLLYNYTSLFPEVDFVWIGTSELKHVENNTHFVTINQFRMTKPFARLAEAYFINTILSLVPDNEDMIYEAFPKYKELKESLEAYHGEEYITASPAIVQTILEEATTNNRWDFTIHSKAIEFQKIMRQFGFLNFLDVHAVNDESKSVVKNIIYVVMKAQKINGALIEDFELTPKIPDEVLESSYEEQLTPQEMEFA